MKIICDHGYYKFFTTAPGELYRFKAAFGAELVGKGDYFTFPELAALEPFTLEGQDYGGLSAKASICADFGEVFKANGFVFDLQTKKLRPVSEIKNILNFAESWSGTLNLAALPQAGGFYNGKRLLSFTGVLDKFFKICEIWGQEYDEDKNI